MRTNAKFKIVYLLQPRNSPLTLQKEKYNRPINATNMQALAITINEYITLLQEFRYMDALDQFYDEDLIKHENEDAPTIGLAAHREEVRQFFNTTSHHQATLKNVIVSNDISVIEWHYEFDHKKWGHMALDQVSVQRWKNGKIMHERHHYKM
jgi:low affinity Fe/Cu permease